MLSRDQVSPSEEADGQERDIRDRDPDPDLRSLPDGGLGENMPDWLRRPPAWRDLSTSETVQVASITSSDPVGQEHGPVLVERVLAPEDTSVIDPRGLIDFEDLPAWLREVGRKPTAVGPLRARDARHAHVDDVVNATGAGPELSSPTASDANVEILESPVSSVSNAFGEGHLHASVGAAEPELWHQGRFIVVLVIALAVAIVLTVLFATGAI